MDAFVKPWREFDMYVVILQWLIDAKHSRVKLERTQRANVGRLEGAGW